jgi:hypothetical protein
VTAGGGPVVVFPVWERRPPLPEDPMERLKALTEEYTAASNAERNYGSSRFANQFWWCLTEVLPAIEERHAKISEERLQQFKDILDRAYGQPGFSQPKPKRDRHGMEAVK